MAPDSRSLAVRPRRKDIYIDLRDDARSLAVKQHDREDFEIVLKSKPNEAPAPAWDDLVPFLEGLDEEIVEMKKTPPISRSLVTLNKDSKPHHWKGAGLCVRAMKSRFKGVLLADPPGMGKTLIPLLAALKSHKKGDPPSVAVMPATCCPQFEKEIPVWFPEGALPAYRLDHGYVPPEELQGYTLIITSFTYITKEYERLQKFLKARQEYDAGTSLIRPKPPRLSLLTGLLTPEKNRRLGNYLILDEAHTVKNIYGSTYAAIRELRECYTACLILTATPFDNSWVDAFALFGLLRGHPIKSLHRMREAFSGTYRRRIPNYDAVPEGKYLDRIQQMMQAVTVVRPNCNDLPELKEYILQFTLSEEEAEKSNRAFEGFGVSEDSKRRGPASGTDVAKLTSLIKAEQLSYHPKLLEVAGLERVALKKSLAGNDEEDDPIDDHELRFLEQWRDELSRRNTWESPRINVILDQVHKNLKSRPDDGILILDESVYFLDIVEIAIGTLRPPVPCFRIDGRVGVAQRDIIKTKFENQYGPRVMLSNRHIAGQGLNFQTAANILIRCGPFWRSSWEIQANGRIHRHGQKKPMKIYEIQETSIDVEKYKIKVRDRNGAVNASIMNPITIADEAPLESPRSIR